jgi:hypothetical protein
MDRHTKQQIKLEMWEQHVTLCYEYKNANSLEESNVHSIVIHSWWYSLGATNVLGFKSWNWLSFWHLFVRQWGGFMIHALLKNMDQHHYMLSFKTNLSGMGLAASYYSWILVKVT